MARYKNGITGSFKGKVGPVVGSSNRGVDYMRSMPEKITKPATAAQKNQRQQFALVVEWLKPLLLLINTGYQSLTDSKTPMNGAVSYHLREAVVRTGEILRIDYSKAIFSRGELLTSHFTELMVEAGPVIQIKWSNPGVTMYSKETDKVYFVVYNPEKRKFVTLRKAAKRVDREARLVLPARFSGDTVYVWMGFISMEGTTVSTTLYVGEVGL